MNQTRPQGSVPSRYLITVLGYGGSSKGLRIDLEYAGASTTLAVKKFPIWGNYHHARDEIRLLGISSSGFVGLFRKIRKLVSIGASRGDHFAGLRNGFRKSFYLEESAGVAPPSLVSKDFKVILTRSAAKSGFLTDSLSLELERSFRRSKSDQLLVITSITSIPAASSWIGNFYNWIFFKLHMRRQNFQEISDHSRDYFLSLPSFNYIRKDFESLDHGTRQTVSINQIGDPVVSQINDSNLNQFYQFRDVQVTLDGSALRFKDESILKLRDLSFSFWPSLLWEGPVSQRVFAPSFRNILRIETPAFYHSINPNWAHFIEDDLPIIYGMFEIDSSRKFYLSSSCDDKMFRLIKYVMPKADLTVIRSLTEVFFRDVIIATHRDPRNLLIQGISSSIPMLDRRPLEEILKNLTPKERSHAKPLRLYIRRSKGSFRTIVNSQELENFLKGHSFHFVQAEDLTLTERLNLFGNAEIVIGATGAGMANLYFAPSGTKVIEIRHPGVEKSMEHLSLVDIRNIDYKVLLGQNPNLYSIMRHGSDSFIVDLKELNKLILNL